MFLHEYLTAADLNPQLPRGHTASQGGEFLAAIRMLMSLNRQQEMEARIAIERIAP